MKKQKKIVWILKFRAILFLFWFAKVGAFNSWLLPKLGHFCKQNQTITLFKARFARNCSSFVMKSTESVTVARFARSTWQYATMALGWYDGDDDDDAY